MTNKSCLPRIPREALWGIGAQSPREYCVGGYHTSKNKLQIKESTVNREKSKMKAATTTLNVLHLTNWLHLCGNDV